MFRFVCNIVIIIGFLGSIFFTYLVGDTNLLILIIIALILTQIEDKLYQILQELK